MTIDILARKVMTIAQRVGAPDVAKQRATPVTITLCSVSTRNSYNIISTNLFSSKWQQEARSFFCIKLTDTKLTSRQFCPTFFLKITEMSIVLGLPNNLPNDFNLFGTKVPGIKIAQEIYSRASTLWLWKSAQIENNIGDNLRQVVYMCAYINC